MNDVTELIYLFFTDELMEILVTETNRYANQYFQKTQVLQQHSRARAWRPVTVDEMEKWLGLTLLTGLIDKKGDLSLYWTRDKTLATPIFSQVMGRNRYQLIARFLHCADNEARPQDCTDKLYKLVPSMII